MSESRQDERIVVRRADDAESKTVTAGTATRTQVLLGQQDGARHFSMRKFTMGPSGGMPRHTNTVEHEQYVLQGGADVSIGDAVHSVEAGHVLYIPAGVPHSYRVTRAPFVFLCLVPNDEDTIEIVG